MKLVILVSDNEADSAVAQNVADLLGAQLIVSPWGGTYDPAASAEILSIDPDRVIIIGGGPVAVPEEYTEDLEEFGIPYERWYGETRYETNLAVIEGGLRDEFPAVFGEIKTVVLSNGRDVLAMEKYLEAMKLDPQGFEGGEADPRPHRRGGEGKPDDGGAGRLQRHSGGQVPGHPSGHGGGPRSPSTGISWGGLDEVTFLRLRGEDPHLLPRGGDEVHALLLSVQNKTERAGGELLDGLQVPAAIKRLERAKEALQMAWDAYNSGEYSEAYRLAVVADFNADFVISRAYSEMRTVYQGSVRMRLEIEIHRLEIMVNVLRGKGYDVSELESLIAQAEKALSRGGQYSLLLNDIIPPRIRHGMKALRTGKTSYGGGNAGRKGGEDHKPF